MPQEFSVNIKGVDFMISKLHGRASDDNGVECVWVAAHPRKIRPRSLETLDFLEHSLPAELPERSGAVGVAELTNPFGGLNPEETRTARRVAQYLQQNTAAPTKPEQAHTQLYPPNPSDIEKSDYEQDLSPTVWLAVPCGMRGKGDAELQEDYKRVLGHMMQELAKHTDRLPALSDDEIQAESSFKPSGVRVRSDPMPIVGKHTAAAVGDGAADELVEKQLKAILDVCITEKGTVNNRANLEQVLLTLIKEVRDQAVAKATPDQGRPPGAVAGGSK